MMPGYQVGAKTGTSSIPENGGYSERRDRLGGRAGAGR